MSLLVTEWGWGIYGFGLSVATIAVVLLPHKTETFFQERLVSGFIFESSHHILELSAPYQNLKPS